MITGIVCRAMDYKDTSKILYIYTPLGNRSVIARGVKTLKSISRFLSQAPNVISFEETRGKFPSLKEGELVEEFSTIHEEIEAFAFVSHILELVQHTIDDDNDHDKMFHFLRRLLRLYNSGKDPEILTFIFELKLLYFLGYGLRFSGCAICKDPSDIVFSISNGGTVCKKHVQQNETYYDSLITDKMKHLYYIDIDHEINLELTQNERIMIRHIIDLLITDYTGYNSKSRSIIKQIKKY